MLLNDNDKSYLIYYYNIKNYFTELTLLKLCKCIFGTEISIYSIPESTPATTRYMHNRNLWALNPMQRNILKVIIPG